MARITVEDCLDKVDNRFQLVMVSSKRARQLQIEGKDPMVSVDNDKPTVIALREIAEGHVTSAILIDKPAMDMQDVEQELEDAVAAVQVGSEAVIAEGTAAAPAPAEAVSVEDSSDKAAS